MTDIELDYQKTAANLIVTIPALAYFLGWVGFEGIVVLYLLMILFTVEGQ